MHIAHPGDGGYQHFESRDRCSRPDARVQLRRPQNARGLRAPRGANRAG